MTLQLKMWLITWFFFFFLKQNIRIDRKDGRTVMLKKKILELNCQSKQTLITVLLYSMIIVVNIIPKSFNIVTHKLYLYSDNKTNYTSSYNFRSKSYPSRFPWISDTTWYWVYTVCCVCMCCFRRRLSLGTWSVVWSWARSMYVYDNTCPLKI